MFVMFLVLGVNVIGCACMPALTLFCFTMMISENKIGPEGAKALALSLGRLAKLTTLTLHGE